MNSKARTLGLLEVTLLHASLQSLVEERVELEWGADRDVVVCLDILLDGLAAVDNASVQCEVMIV